MAATTRGESSSVVPAPLALVPTIPETPSKRAGKSINDFLHYFCGQFDIVLPIGEVVSPDKRVQSLGHDLLKKIRPLFYSQAHEHLLHDAIADLKARRPPVRDQPDRLQILEQRLGEAVMSSALTPHSRRTVGSPVRTFAPALPAEAPPSPTLSVKHAPPQSQRVMAPPQPKSAATSFTTMNTSFTSDATSNTKASQSTDATSVSASQVLPPAVAQEPSNLAKAVGAAVVAPWANEVEAAAPDDEECTIITPENHRVRKIPKHGLATHELPESLKALPFCLRVEAHRVMRLCKLSAVEFETKWTEKTLKRLWKLKDEHAKGTGRRFIRGFDTDYEDHTLCAKLRWSKSNTGPLFDLEMHPPRREDSNAFQRKFGSHRILVVDLPDLDRPPEVLRGQRTIVTRVLELLSKEQPLLGRTWLQFHAKRKKGPEADPDEASNYQVSFVALKAEGLPDISIRDLIDFAIPMRENARQHASKAYSRLDLAASRTKALSALEVEQISFMPDLMSDNVPDDGRFNDPTLQFPSRPLDLGLLEMTDGCGEVSLEVMQEVQQKFQLTYLPSVFQARICHSKGLWYYMPDSPPGRWIRIRDSQRKLVRVNLDGDKEWRTLNINGYSLPAKTSILYPGFIPILRDRGVPSEAITELAKQQINLEGDEFLNALEDPPELHRWIFSQKDMMGTRRTKGGIPELAEFPIATDERIELMLESGFEPTKSAYLKKQVLDAAEHVFNSKAKRFKVRLSKSTSLLGVPDMTGTLKPGEVHIMLSQPLKDKVSGEIWSSLHGLDILIARNASLRNADIQKIRCVYKPELAHLRDVVVFSIHGPRPLASKLSGGDYDGDTFWICWEPTLVEPFKNAPAPWKLRAVEGFGIVKDTVTLGEVLGIGTTGRTPTEAAVRRWIQKGTTARMTVSMLPVVTLFHGRLVYALNNVSAFQADLLVDLHDHLVDADKQGFRYDMAAYDLWRFQNGIPRSGLLKPAHCKFTRKNGGGENVPEKPNPHDCVDEMYFGTVEPALKMIMHRAKAATKDAIFQDRDLTRLYDSISQSPTTVVQSELKNLSVQLKALEEEWSRSVTLYVHDKSHDRSEWVEIAIRCRNKLLAIMPADCQHDIVLEWLREEDAGPTRWERLRLSALAKRQKSDGTLLFTIAGAELCLLKARSLPKGRTVRLDAYALMKPQKRGEWAEMAADENLEDGDSEDEHEDTLYEGASLFDGSELGMILDAAAATPTTNRKRKSSPSRESMVKRRQSDYSSPSSSRSKQIKQPSPPTSRSRTKQRTPRADTMDWLTGTPPSGAGTASQRPEWLKRND
ncbi:hypothetical protein LTR17_020587 [Elasticomyces elasticus]|nr:hypothetical protein LTR17_020587 [Elasticomyces elasticus]